MPTPGRAEEAGDGLLGRNDAYLPQLHGRIYVDGQAYDHSSTALGSGVAIGTARLTVSGRATRAWRYRIQYDFANKLLKYAWLRYDGFEAAHLKIGQFKEPLSLEELTSSRFITFIERGLPNALVPGYHVGVQYAGATRHWTAAAGAFSESANSAPSSGGGNAGIGMTGRVTWSPVNDGGALLHLGIGATYRLPGSQHSLLIRESPESKLTGIYYINTATIDGVDHSSTVDAEGAAVRGAWSAQSEYMQTQVSRHGGAQGLIFRGAYAFVSWFATGESLNYRTGRFRRVKPLHKMGALQVAARFSFLDLNSGTVTGGREDDVTLGVNWYLNDHMRVMFNYIKVHARFGSGTQNPDIYLARFQSDF